MNYQKFTPSPLLQPWVECYYQWTGLAEKELEVQSPPSARTALVFNLAGPCQSYQQTSTRIEVPMTFLCGQFTSNYHIVLNGSVHMIGIVFRPFGIHDFFNLRMSMLVNTRMDLSLVIGSEAGVMLNKLKEKTTDRIALLESFLMKRLPAAKKKVNVINDVVSYIDQKRGNVTVQEAAEKFGVSKRYVEKHFLEKVGTSPKLYARTIRFSYISLLVASKEKVDWQEIIELYGLHDQSHLVKEFIEFNRRNPTEYHQNHNELIRLVKK